MTEVRIKFLTPAQAAEFLNIPENTVRTYARRGVIPARKFGKHWRFLEAELLKVGVNKFASLPPVRVRTAPITGQSNRTDRESVTAAHEQ
jgi:excisionase family DNA binding protein